jgi:hypothetical protein
MIMRRESRRVSRPSRISVVHQNSQHRSGFHPSCSRAAAKATIEKKSDVASTGDSAIPVTQWESTCASAAANPRNAKIRLINDDPYRTISDIKLKRTDTTLDLSQKAIKNVC